MGAHARDPDAQSVPEPERWEPTLADPRLRDLTPRDWLAVFRRATADTIEDDMPMVASAVSYSSFFAIPSILLLAVGLFTLVATPDTIEELTDRFSTFMPTEATELLGDSLRRLDEQPSTSILVTIVGLLLALWASTSAMTTYMTALDIAYDRKDGRSFVRKRLVALLMVVAIGAAVLLVGLLLIFGPHLERFLGDQLGLESVFTWVWWTAQWPLLFLGLLTAFAVLRPRKRSGHCAVHHTHVKTLSSPSWSPRKRSRCGPKMSSRPTRSTAAPMATTMSSATSRLRTKLLPSFRS